MIRDRIKALRRVPVSALQPHPGNWRVHPDRQRRAMAHVLDKVGYADALLVRPLEGEDLDQAARFEIIDGHLRAETTPDAQVPVLVLDVSSEEAALLLATHDPLAGMAETDGPALAALLEQLEIQEADLDAHLAHLAAPPPESAGLDAPLAECPIPESYQVLVDCRDEDEQRAVFEQLRDQGHACRVLTL